MEEKVSDINGRQRYLIVLEACGGMKVLGMYSMIARLS